MNVYITCNMTTCDAAAAVTRLGPVISVRVAVYWEWAELISATINQYPHKTLFHSQPPAQVIKFQYKITSIMRPRPNH